MKEQAMICLDIGGTNLRMGLVNRQYYLSDVQIVSTADNAGACFLDNLSRCIADYRCQVEERVQVVAVSVGVPAAVNKARTVVLQAPNVPGLDGQNVVAALENALALPVFLAKDVDLLLTYDLVDLALPQDALIVGIYFGTGIGNSIFYGGRILTGKNGAAGELGHIPQLGSTTACGCGNTGCIEPLGGGRQLQELCRSCFPDTHISQIYQCHAHTEAVRAQVDAMAVVVATEVNILDPDYVIIGGGLPQMAGFPVDHFLERIRLHTRKPLPAANLDILFSRPKQENGIIGAGIYGWSRLEQQK